MKLARFKNKNLFIFQNPSRGLTVIEFLVLGAIFGILAIVGPKLIQNSIKIWKISKGIDQVNEQQGTNFKTIENFLSQAVPASIKVTRHNQEQPPDSKIIFSHFNGNEIHIFQVGSDLWIFQEDVSGEKQNKIIGSDIRFISFEEYQIEMKIFVNVEICFEKGQYGAETKKFYLSSYRIPILSN